MVFNKTFFLHIIYIEENCTKIAKSAKNKHANIANNKHTDRQTKNTTKAPQ